MKRLKRVENNQLSVKVREVFGYKSKLKFSENSKRMIAGVGLISLAGGEDKHSHLKKPKYKITQLFKMREKGYFRDVDTKIPICEILDNCEVI